MAVLFGFVALMLLWYRTVAPDAGVDVDWLIMVVIMVTFCRSCLCRPCSFCIPVVALSPVPVRNRGRTPVQSDHFVTMVFTYRRNSHADGCFDRRLTPSKGMVRPSPTSRKIMAVALLNPSRPVHGFFLGDPRSPSRTSM